MSRRRLPPYLRRHVDQLRKEASSSVWIAIGADAWQWARTRDRSHHIAIVCPLGDDPAGYDWRPCAGHDPVLLVRAGPTEGEQVRALIEAVIRDGTDRVMDNGGALYVAQEVAHAA